MFWRELAMTLKFICAFLRQDHLYYNAVLHFHIHQTLLKVDVLITSAIILFVGSDDQCALVLFEEEGTFFVVLQNQTKEEHYRYNQTVNGLWEKGKSAQYYKAKLMLCGRLFHIDH